MMRIQRLCLAVLLLAGWAAPSRADVKMPAIFGSHMVLQRGMKTPIWGTADPGEKITVGFAGQKMTTETGSDGRWKLALEPMVSSIRSRSLTVSGKNTLTFEDVLVGDVWLCSGQSNMWWPAKLGVVNGDKEIKAAKYPRIRMITIPAVPAPAPQDSFDGKQTPDVGFDGQWAECTPEVMKDFSAVGYFFGREVHQRVDVPIGLIGSYWGGTPAQAWTSHEGLAAEESLKVYFTRWEEYTAKYPEAKAKYDARAATAKAKGQKLSWIDLPPQDPIMSPGRPSNLFNGMIAPLVPFGLRGAIWYQGEANAGNPQEAVLYHRLLSTMITDWRTHWGQGDFPFLFVQLANFQARMNPEGESSWALLRESQCKTLALPATGMAVAIDAGDARDIHPHNKQVVGQRLALAAFKVAYGKDVEYSGPVFEGMAVQHDRIILRFSHVGAGLESRAPEGIKGFAIAGSDKQFVGADARIEGETVVVSSPQVPDPVAVRYAWGDSPEASLYNKAGLPATPFRTDTWEVAAVKTEGLSKAAGARQPADKHQKIKPVKK